MRLYGDINKIDKEQRMVWGYASTETVDRVGEIVSKAAIEEALDDYLDYANIREMHQLSAVGTTKEASVDAKGLYIGAHIVDDKAWAKVTSGVYKGFSIGGKALERDPMKKTTITKVRLDEISLVDRPANPDARFDIWKAAGAEDDLMAKKDAEKDEIGKTETSGETPAAVEKAATFELGVPPISGEGVGSLVAGGVGGDGLEGIVVEAPVLEKTAEVAPVVEPETVAEVIDPVAKATASLDALDIALGNKTQVAEFGKGMYTVASFAGLLKAVSYMVQETDYEAQSEGDNSPVPAALRDWLTKGTQIFLTMAQEEVTELVSKAAAGDLLKSDVMQDLQKSLGTEVTPDSIKKMFDENERLTQGFTDLTTRMEPMIKSVSEMHERLERIEKTEVPAKTMGSGGSLLAISKGVDATGAAQTSEPMTSDDIAKAMSSMTQEEQTLILTKAALSQPKRLNLHSVTK